MNEVNNLEGMEGVESAIWGLINEVQLGKMKHQELVDICINIIATEIEKARKDASQNYKIMFDEFTKRCWNIVFDEKSRTEMRAIAKEIQKTSVDMRAALDNKEAGEPE